MECHAYLLRLLARREYSARELERKARQRGFDASDIAAALAHLQQQGEQSDAEVAEAIIRHGQGRYGKPALRQKCRAKGIDAETFERAWAELADAMAAEPLLGLKAQVQRKYGIRDFRYLDRKTKAKLARFLQYRGFNPGTVLAQWQAQAKCEPD